MFRINGCFNFFGFYVHLKLVEPLNGLNFNIIFALLKKRLYV